MESRYDSVMKNIEVTADMRDKILNNIDRLDFNKVPSKFVSLSNYKKYLSIAACFVLLLFGTVIVHNISNFPHDPLQQGTADIVEYSSADELSEALGFTVKELQNVPFDVDTVQYTAFWKEFSQIEYTGQSNTASFRMSAAAEDISGDYSSYTEIKTVTVNGCDVTLKGNGSQYRLAIWQAEGYSYSVQFTEAISEQEMLAALQSTE